MVGVKRSALSGVGQRAEQLCAAIRLMPASVWSIAQVLVALAHHVGDAPPAQFSASAGCDRVTPTVAGVITNHPVKSIAAFSPSRPGDRFDRRGRGRSTSRASDPATGLSGNTTELLVTDRERRRERLQIECWSLPGGSWGTRLILRGHAVTPLTAQLARQGCSPVEGLAFGGRSRFRSPDRERLTPRSERRRPEGR